LPEPIVLNTDGTIIGGHARYQSMKQQNIVEAFCAIPERELTEHEFEELNIRLNKNIAGDFDFDMLANEFELSDLVDWGFDEKDLNIDISQGGGDGAEPQMDKAEELREKWNVQPGQLWRLGEHLILCGDSTKTEDVARVLQGGVPGMMVTDPPYGVEYDPSWRADAGINKNQDKMGKVENDDIADWTPAWRLFPGDVAYVYHAGLMANVVQASLELAGFQIRQQLIWAKDRMALSRGDYHWQHEPCWYAVRKGKTSNRTDDRTQTTLWEIPSREDSGHGHGTQKPVECMARAIRNHNIDLVYEPFSGSGTTIIACENLKRKCRAIEISPAYVAVAIQRFVDTFQVEPVLLRVGA
jgi:DNA modification methylase